MQQISRYSVNSQVISNAINADTLVMNLKTGIYYTLDTTAGEIWKLLETPPSAAQIHAYVTARFEADDAERMHRAVDEFLGELLAEQLVLETRSNLPEAVLPPVTEKTAFTAPFLMRFDDLKSMMSGQQLTPETRLTPTHADIVSERYDNEVVILNIQRGIYYSLVGSAATIWTGVMERMTFRSIVASLSAQYTAPNTEMQNAARDFLHRLKDEELLVFVASDGSERPSYEVTPSATKVAFKEPTFDRFTDLQDLLRLDPVHDVAPEGWPLESRS